MAGQYPAASETFVWREVAALRQRGLKVAAAALRPASTPAEGAAPADLFVYGHSALSTLLAGVFELVAHPLACLRTLGIAVKDALTPGESASIRERGKWLGQAAFAIGLAGRLRRRGVRRLHCHFAHAPTTVGMYASAQLGVPFTFTGHANDLFQRRSLLKRKLQRAAGVACISAWHRGYYAGIEPSADAKCHVIRCGVDVPGERGAAAGQWRTKHIVSVGRLVPKKGFDTLIRAFADLGGSGQPAWRLTLAGDGPQREELETLATELGCDRAICFAGRLSHDQVGQLLSEAALFVLPCRTDANGDRDGIPVVLMEAMAYGVPVVAGDLPAIRELVVDGHTGFLVDGSDALQLADRLRQVVATPEEASSVAAAGRQHVQAEFSTEANIDRLVAMWAEAEPVVGRHHDVPMPMAVQS